jgi:hypothetical protein
MEDVTRFSPWRYVENNGFFGISAHGTPSSPELTRLRLTCCRPASAAERSESDRSADDVRKGTVRRRGHLDRVPKIAPERRRRPRRDPYISACSCGGNEALSEGIASFKPALRCSRELGSTEGGEMTADVSPCASGGVAQHEPGTDAGRFGVSVDALSQSWRATGGRYCETVGGSGRRAA